MHEILTLISETAKQTPIGDTVTEEVRRVVFVQELVVGATYKLQALAAGLKPKYRLKMADYLDYNGEQKAEYNGELLRIIDATKHPDNSLELTLEGVV